MSTLDNLENTVFTTKLREDFVENGFIFYPNFLNDKEINLVKNKISEFIESKLDKMDKKDVYYENINDKSTLKQLQRLFEFDPFFFDMMLGSQFEKLASINT